MAASSSGEGPGEDPGAVAKVAEAAEDGAVTCLEFLLPGPTYE